MATQSARTTRPLLLRQFIRTVRDRRLFGRGEHLLVALSGGPDSTALLALLIRLAPSWQLKLTAIHLNYRLRGRESDEDEAFVSALCRDRGIPLAVRYPVLVKPRKQSSLQAVAREVRYAAMKEEAGAIGADRIVVGHTANDQAETIFMWMLRGAGLSGLAGMPFVREGVIVRPLLSFTRDEVIEFLRQEGLPYRQDSSNGADRYRRNRIRKELLPVVTRLAPTALRALQRQADLLRAEDEYLEQVLREQWPSLAVRDAGGGYRIDRQRFAELPVALQRRMIRRLLRAYEPDERAAGVRVIETVRRFFLTGRPSGRVTLRRVVVSRDGRGLKIATRPADVNGQAGESHEPHTAVPVTIPSTVAWARTGTQFHVQVMSRERAEPLLRSRSPRQALFDADRVTPPLFLRSWRAGDRFYPCGMGGKSKKLQDLFTDLKIPRSGRAEVPVLAGSEGILWIAGVRQDERFVVRERTVRCLVVTMSGKSAEEGAQ